MASQLLNSLLLLSSLFLSSTNAHNSSLSSASSPTPPLNSTKSLESHLYSLKSVCRTTPYPDHCFDTLKLSLSINISPNILNVLLQSLKAAFSQGLKLSDLFSNAGRENLIEKQRGTLQDCTELHQITLSALQKSISRINSRNKLSDARAFLSAALTNKVTCLEGLDSAHGPLKPALVDSLTSTYAHISNSLSLLPRPGSPAGGGGGRRRLLGYPRWVSRKARRVLQSSGEEYDPSEVVTVAADGTGNFTTIGDAINLAPNNSVDRIFIYIREGVYEENVEIPSWKPNIVLLGDGRDVTVISGSKSVGDGWTTFRSATLAVSGEGFLARDLTFENTAGPGKHQAVALRINADLAAVYRCTITGYQDTLYIHSFRQFYRECDIYGTIDYIFGNAAVIFQGCNIVSRMPMPGQATVITAQSRDTPDEDTGISMQNCSVLATDDLYSNSNTVKSFLGRPWKNYSRTVLLESYIDDFIAPVGWSKWVGDQGLDTLYYGEYENYGPGSSTDGRVSWAGYHVMDYYDASNFTVSEFISGQDWLDSTSFPYDDGV
ncbi:probable pectinesterase/pectinesterase inhibitor 12 [Phtheirospermum japonicum]|uniref:Pectinesterase n=1 Tax=Phtheirospermum japonicum TaxID=374723 RepID=A0A830CDE1_9LAMI|nr:probable pectinesterase/pectinesterase inhibitor 12 [Phtheirospermum japonicum]